MVSQIYLVSLLDSPSKTQPPTRVYHSVTTVYQGPTTSETGTPETSMNTVSGYQQNMLTKSVDKMSPKAARRQWVWLSSSLEIARKTLETVISEPPISTS